LTTNNCDQGNTFPHQHEEEKQHLRTPEENIETPSMQGLAIPKISIPKNFLKITPEAVAELIDKKDPSYVLIDVRGGDYVGGRILLIVLSFRSITRFLFALMFLKQTFLVQSTSPITVRFHDAVFDILLNPAQPR